MKSKQTDSKPLKVEDILQLETYKHLTRDQAQEVLDFIRTYCEIVMSIVMKQEQRKLDAQQ